MRQLIIASAFALAAMAGPGLAQEAGSERLARFHSQVETDPVRLDFSTWTTILEAIVFDVGHSDRRDPGAPRKVTGSLLPVESSSRYRYENNRVIYHLMEDVHREAISQYRADLEAVASQVDIAALPRDEQLAYWLNLYNVVVIDEIARRYPERRVNRIRIDGQGLYEAPVIVLDGTALSLNDIRFGIVQAQWRDPRIIYGFYSGAVGGPALNNQAFEGRSVWSQLERNGREFVNALRGIDNYRGRPRISPLYDEHRALFPQWPDALYDHLRAYAFEETLDGLAPFEGEPEFLDYDTSVGDITNGRTGCGSAGALPIDIVDGSGRHVGSVDCRVLPASALGLMEVVIERRLRNLREGNFGRVTIRDLPSPDPQAQDPQVFGTALRPSAQPAPQASEEAPQEAEAGTGSDEPSQHR